METVTISPKFQVVIPKKVRESLRLKAGQKLQIIYYQNQLVLIPLQPAETLRGIARGMDTTVEREADRV